MTATTTNAGSLSSGKVKSENENKNFSKKLLTKTKTALRYVSRFDESGEQKNATLTVGENDESLTVEKSLKLLKTGRGVKRCVEF